MFFSDYILRKRFIYFNKILILYNLILLQFLKLHIFLHILVTLRIETIKRSNLNRTKNRAQCGLKISPDFYRLLRNENLLREVTGTTLESETTHERLIAFNISL